MILQEALEERILVLDGAMGTMLQRYSWKPEDFLGAKDCYEILNLTNPDIVQEIHENYILAGADLIETNSFNCNSISLKQHSLEERVYEIAKKSAEIAKKATKVTSREIFVVGSVGPSHKSLHFLCQENHCSEEAPLVMEMKKAYYEGILGLVDGGVDGILIETVFDSWNAKAAVLAAEEVFHHRGIKLPILVSATVNQAGTLATGETVEDLILTLERDSIFAFGLNCSCGIKSLFPLLRTMKKQSNRYLCFYPNAGLPNPKGEYMVTPEKMKEELSAFLKEGLVNIVGACCGSSYEHIEAIASLVKEGR